MSRHTAAEETAHWLEESHGMRGKWTPVDFDTLGRRRSKIHFADGL